MAQNQYSIIVLISGRGSNLKALIDNAFHYKIKAVLSNRSDALGLEHAKNAGICTLPFDRAEGEKLSQFKSKIRQQIITLSPNIVVLAGYMQIIEPELIHALPGRIINIHPSLLPAHPGLHTHERAIAAGDKEHGCTVHVVDQGVDTGPIVAQAAVPILPTDSAESLAARVLQQEHRLYPWVINQLACQAISIADREIRVSNAARAEAKELGFRLPAMRN